MLKKRLAAAFILVLFGASVKVILSVKHDYAVINTNYSDHFSHDQATILALYRGLGVYEPIRQTCNHADDFVGAKPPADKLNDRCYLRERGNREPLWINWSQVPRAYPPGLFLYSLPEALLFEAGWVNFQTENRITVIKYLGACCVLLWLLGQLFFGSKPTTGDMQIQGTIEVEGPAAAPAAGWAKWLAVARHWLQGARDQLSTSPWPLFGLALWPLLASEVLQWSLVGFYDPLAVAFGVAAFIATGQRRWTRSSLWLSLAIFSHFRMLWYLPLFAWNLWQLGLDVRRRPAGQSIYKSLRGAERRDLGVAAVLLLASFGAFMEVWPKLRIYPAQNPLRNGFILSQAHLTFWLPVGCLIVYQLYKSDWLQAACSMWLAFMLYQTQQFMPWHTLSLIPTFAVAYAQGGKLRHLATATLLVTAASLWGFSHLPNTDWVPLYTALLRN